MNDVGHIDCLAFVKLLPQLRNLFTRHRQNVEDIKLGMYCQSTICTGTCRPSRRWARMAILVTIQSRILVCSIPKSVITTSTSANSGSGRSSGCRALTECQHLARPLLEVVQLHGAGGECHHV